MLILNKGKKDYYDYLAGVYGIDKDIVFDRTEFTVLSHINHFTSVDLSFFFDPERMTIFTSSHNDCLRHPQGWTKEVYGRKKSFVLEVGFYQYLFEVDRYIDEGGEVHIEPTLVSKFDKGVHIGKTPITLFPYKEEPIRTSGYYTTNGWDRVKEDMVYKLSKSYQVDNPIVSGTWITGFIPAEELYNNIYNYLIACREPVIEDKRNDIQKLESKGFDKKTSFRNPINKRRK